FTAEPSVGYRFSGWDGLPGQTDSSITMQLPGNLTVTAHFDPKLISLRALANAGQLILNAHGPVGDTCFLEVSNDLATWNEIGAVTFDDEGNASRQFAISPGSHRVFYQLKLSP